MMHRMSNCKICPHVFDQREKCVCVRARVCVFVSVALPYWIKNDRIELRFSG